MQHPLISIIIPVYNVENYLSKCIDSVLQQNYKDIEIILVDDGSQDNCPHICDEYAAKDNRIVVIHKENGGASDARNAGIKVAKGKYVMFLDDDDYWAGDNCLQNIVTRLNISHPDVLIYGCMDYFVNRNQIKVSRSGYNLDLIRDSSKDVVLKYYFESGLFPGSAWINVVRRDLIIDNNIFFIKELKIEDIDWLLNVYLTAESFDAVNDTFYIYLKHRNNSVTGTADSKSFDDVVYTIKTWINKLQSPKYDYIKEHVLSHLAYELATTYILLNKLSKEERNRKAEIIKEYSYLLSFGKQRKIKLVNLINKVLGVKRTSLVLSRLYKMKNG